MSTFTSSITGITTRESSPYYGSGAIGMRSLRRPSGRGRTIATIIAVPTILATVAAAAYAVHTYAPHLLTIVS